MGQKTNPIGIRLGINKTWSSIWFDEKNYASKLHEDILIRKFLNKKLSDASIAKTEIERKKIFQDAKLLSESGAFAIVIECVEQNLAAAITRSILVPTIGIGASQECDGQILVTDDLVGLSNLSPKFLKKYSNLKKIISKSVLRFRKDVIYKKFPGKINIY